VYSRYLIIKYNYDKIVSIEVFILFWG